MIYMSQVLDQLSFKDRTMVWARRAVEWMKFIFTPLALGFLAYFGWHTRDALRMVFEQARPGYLAASVLLWVVLHFFAPVFPTLVFRACGSRITYGKAFMIHARRLPGRYVPGGIWHTVGRFIDYHDHGIQPRHLATGIFMESTFPAVISFILGGIGISLFHDMSKWGGIGLLAAFAALLGLAIIPVVINRRMLKAPDHFPMGAYFKSMGVITLYWMIAAAAFICYIKAFPMVKTESSPIEIGAAYLFSWGIGYLAVIAPQGIGVFEVVAGNILSTPLSLGGVAVVVAGFRLVTLAADMMVWSLSRLR